MSFIMRPVTIIQYHLVYYIILILQPLIFKLKIWCGQPCAVLGSIVRWLTGTKFIYVMLFVHIEIQ